MSIMLGDAGRRTKKCHSIFLYGQAMGQVHGHPHGKHQKCRENPVRYDGKEGQHEMIPGVPPLPLRGLACSFIMLL